MMCLLGRFGRQDLQLSRRHHRWKLLTPTVLWSIVILAMTPSLQGFGLAGIPVGSIGLAGGISLPRIQPQQGPEGASAGDLSSGAVQPRSLAAPGSWLKDRIKDGKKRVKQQVTSMTEQKVDHDLVENGPVPPAERVFNINGWRWHTRVAIRDAGRFRRVALLAAEAEVVKGVDAEALAASMDRVVKSYRHMWNFSFSKLHFVETEVFFPWLKDVLPREAVPPFSQFDREREVIIRIGQQIGQSVEEAVRASKSRRSPRAALIRCADLSLELEARASALSRTQEVTVMPITSAYIQSKLQNKLNDKVIRSLGLVDAQVLLVAMYDTLKPDHEEYGTFRAEVPKFARALIPTWRRVLYSPRAACLEESGDLAMST